MNETYGAFQTSGHFWFFVALGLLYCILSIRELGGLMGWWPKLSWHSRFWVGAFLLASFVFLLTATGIPQ